MHKIRSFYLVHLWHLSFLGVFSFLLAGCNHQAPIPSIPIYVSAPPALKPALADVQSSFQQREAYYDLTLNYIDDSLLPTQTSREDPTVLFITTNESFIQALENSGQAHRFSTHLLMQDRLVLITPLQQHKIKSFADLVKSTTQSIAIASTDNTSLGQYTQSTLKHQGLLNAVSKKVRLYMDGRSIIEHVEQGKADAGIAFLSQAKLNGSIQLVELAPEDSHPPIVYYITSLTQHPRATAAASVSTFFRSPHAQALFRNHGLIYPSD